MVLELANARMKEVTGREKKRRQAAIFVRGKKMIRMWCHRIIRLYGVGACGVREKAVDSAPTRL